MQVRFNPEKPYFAVIPVGSRDIMKSVHVGKGKGKGSAFVHGHHKMFNFRAESVAARQNWVQSVRNHSVALRGPNAEQYSVAVAKHGK